VQVVCLRPRLERPQLVATSRHVTCGGPDLRSCPGRMTPERASEAVAGTVRDLPSTSGGIQFVEADAGGARRRPGGGRARRVSSGSRASGEGWCGGRCSTASSRSAHAGPRRGRSVARLCHLTQHLWEFP
jgi:hypothetical protein